MKVITKTFPVYSFEELSNEVKERVKQWYLDDDIRNECFYTDIMEDLKNLFPNSNLDVCFSLGYCQGDGLNVYGTINFNDFLKIDKNTNSKVFENYTEKEIKRLKFYFQYFNEYTFKKNSRYCYSCKFIDKKYKQDTISEFVNELKDNYIRNIDISLINCFFNNLLEWFSDYDGNMEDAGYKYFYDIEDEEMEEICFNNDWMFLESGKLYA